MDNYCDKKVDKDISLVTVKCNNYQHSYGGCINGKRIVCSFKFTPKDEECNRGITKVDWITLIKYKSYFEVING